MNRKNPISTQLAPASKGVGIMTRILTTSILAVLLVSFLGCAQELGKIDRVQPDALKKSLFAGELYFKQTVIDAPATGAYSFIGDQGSMVRGVFDIQESTLYFYRTYEFVDDAESIGFRSDKDTPLCRAKKGNEELTDQDLEWCNKNLSKAQASRKIVTRTMEVCGASREVPVVVYRGAPIAAWPILGHFDVIYEYNPTTGERMNVQSENTTDRYWSDREFMRVDFAANSVGAYHTMGALADYTSFSIYEGDAAAPDERIRFEDAAGMPTESSAKLAYFDFLTDHVLEGLTDYLEGYGTIPYCWYYPWYSGGVYECVSERIRVRNSFMRVDKVNEGKPSDYVAQGYDDVHMNKFGYFRTERLDWDCNFGTTYSGAMRKSNRHRIWESYVQNPDGSLNYGSMTPKPIVYYLSKGTPRDLVPVSLRLAQEWSEPFDAVAAARKPGAPIDHPMFILCENSDAEAQAALQIDPTSETACWTGSPQAYCAKYCKRMDRPHENGDIRYNFLYAVTEPLQAGLYGFGPSSADPLTGEIITASAYNYAAPMKLGARNAIDVIELLAGVKDWREIEHADDREFENRVKRLVVAGEPPFYSVDDAKHLARNLLDPDVALRLKTAGISTTDRDVSQARLDLLRQMPELEEMVGGEYVRMLFKDPRLGSPAIPSREERAQFSLASFKHEGGWKAQLDYHRKMAERNLYLAEFADGAILGLAREYGARYDAAVCQVVRDLPDSAVDMGAFDDQTNVCTTRKVVDALAAEIRRVDLTSPRAIYLPKSLWWPTKDDRIYATQKAIRDTITQLREQFSKELWQNIYFGVAEHEMGHTLGLRHNFEGSTDALNFDHQYWDLRGQSAGQGWQPTGGAFGDETLEQAAGKMREFQSSTVMEYGAKFNARFQGLGNYDRAAIKYAYGELSETFASPPNLAPFTGYLADPADEDPTDYRTFLVDNNPMERVFRRVHYTKIPELFGGNPAALYERTDFPLENFSQNQPCDPGTADPCGPAQFCEHTFKGDFCVDMGAQVPHRFCSDEQNGVLPTCATWDEGVDAYEIVRNTFNDYEEYWPFWGFQRDSVLFNPSRYNYRIYSTFKTGQRQMQFWLSEYARLNKGDWWQNHFGVPFEEDINGGLSGALATSISFNTMAQALGRPIQGWYGFHTRNERFEPYSQQDSQHFDNASFVYVDEHAGARQMYPNYDYDGYLPVIRSAGAIYDRLNAFEVLTDPGTYLLANPQGEQIRRYLISFYTAFPRQMTRLLGSIMADDHNEFGWCVRRATADAPADDVTVDARRRVFVGPDTIPCDPATEVPLFPEPKYTFPTTKFRMPALAALYGMAYMTQDFETNFLDVTHIYMSGHEDAVAPIGGVTPVTFADPLSGKIYSAHPSNDATLYDVAVQIVNHANKEFARFQGESEGYYLSDLQYLVGKLELFRGMARTFSYY